MDEPLLPSALAEAVDMHTTSERLAELAQHVELQPLIAANPVTPAAVLEQLSASANVTIRRAVVQNPNTSLQILSALACEFPQEFMSNPLIPILNMTDLSFIKRFPSLSWASLLRFEKLPTTWLQQIKIDKSYQRNHPSVWKLIQLHVSQIGDADRPWRSEANSELADYRKKLPPPSFTDPAIERDILLLFSLLSPATVPMLKEQWVQAAKAQPHSTGVALASCRTIGDKTLRALLIKNNIFIHCQIARHPRTSVKILSRLAVHHQTQIRRAVASNPHTPEEIISTLIADLEPSVRRTAITHPSLTRFDYKTFMIDKDASVRAALASLSQLDHTLLTQLASDPDASVRAASARNSKISEEILTILAHDPDSVVRAAAASNPRLSHEDQSALLTDPEEAVRASLSGNARLLEQCMIQLAQDTSLLVRKYLAANPRVPITLLDQFGDSKEIAIWSGLAHHPHTSPELLTRMAQRGDAHIQALVAAHKHTPVEVLQTLASQNVRAIWYGLVANPHAPLDILERALTTPYTGLWPRIFNHPVMVHNQHRPFLALLISKIQPLIACGNLPSWVRRAVFQYYTALPAALLEPFAGSPYWEERYLAAIHPHSAMPLLDTLSQDGIYYVRAGAQHMRERRQHTSNHSI